MSYHFFFNPNNPKKYCVPNYDDIENCMQADDKYREFALQNSHTIVNEKPEDKYVPNDMKMNFTSYNQTFNYYDPKTELNAFTKCSKKLYDECVEKISQ